MLVYNQSAWIGPEGIEETMMYIEKDGNLVPAKNKLKHITNIHNSFSSEEQIEIDLCEAEDEDKLVYVTIQCDYLPTNLGKYVKLELIFNEKSIANIEKVVKWAKEKFGVELIKIDIHLRKTFEVKESELEQWEKEALQNYRSPQQNKKKVFADGIPF